MINFLNILIVLHLLIYVIPVCFSSSNLDLYNSCAQNFTCGNVVNVSFPFWGGSRPKECGYSELELTCEDVIKPVIAMKGMKFYVKGINQKTNVLTIAREDLSDGLCLHTFVNTTLDFTRFYNALGTQNITILYGCPAGNPNDDSYGGSSSGAYRAEFYCRVNGVPDTNTNSYIQPGVTGPNGCDTSVVVPVSYSSNMQLQQNSSNVILTQAIQDGFDVNYKLQDGDVALCSSCAKSQGRCGVDVNTNKAICTCSDGSSSYTPCGVKSSGKSLKSSVIIGVAVGGGLVAAFVVACVLMMRRRKRILSQARTKDLPSMSSDFASGGFSHGYSTSPSTYMSRTTPSYPSSKSDLDNSSYLGVKLFSYSELQEATDNFSESRELGDGGFGTVYYGKLNDGRVVAVKRLYENSVKRMGQFMNEVQLLAHLRHDNLVTLYGCTSKRSRELLLVYEYISNGTVADHIHGKKSVSNKLPWSTRLSIAVESAEALSFLHDKEVIHRDVKTNNILLDDNFRVKVADFGLSRLFPTDVTHVSTAPQGTPGYVDPDYYQCYHLTEKSDVYSFGVVIMELISSKVAVDITRHRHDINLSNMAIDRIQKHALHELVDPYLEYDKDCVLQKMVKLTAELAFRCLQPDKETRPTMKEVLVALKDIQKMSKDAQNQVVVDIQECDDVGLLKIDPPFLPEPEANGKR